MLSCLVWMLNRHKQMCNKIRRWIVPQFSAENAGGGPPKKRQFCPRPPAKIGCCCLTISLKESAMAREINRTSLQSQIFRFSSVQLLCSAKSEVLPDWLTVRTVKKVKKTPNSPQKMPVFHSWKTPVLVWSFYLSLYVSFCWHRIPSLLG